MGGQKISHKQTTRSKYPHSHHRPTPMVQTRITTTADQIGAANYAYCIDGLREPLSKVSPNEYQVRSIIAHPTPSYPFNWGGGFPRTIVDFPDHGCCHSHRLCVVSQGKSIPFDLFTLGAAYCALQCISSEGKCRTVQDTPLRGKLKALISFNLKVHMI